MVGAVDRIDPTLPRCIYLILIGIVGVSAYLETRGISWKILPPSCLAATFLLGMALAPRHPSVLDAPRTRSSTCREALSARFNCGALLPSSIRRPGVSGCRMRGTLPF